MHVCVRVYIYMRPLWYYLSNMHTVAKRNGVPAAGGEMDHANAAKRCCVACYYESPKNVLRVTCDRWIDMRPCMHVGPSSAGSHRTAVVACPCLL